MTISKNQNIVKMCIPLLLVLHLVFIMIVKYSINDLTAASFRFNYLGNIFNILLFLITISGYGIAVFFNSLVKSKELFIILTIALILFIPSLIVIVINGTDLSFGVGYLFGVPLKKIILGVLFFAEILFQLYLLFLIWGHVIDRKNISHIRSVYISLISILFLLFFAFFYTIGYGNSNNKLEDNEQHEIAVILGAAVWSYDKPSPLFEGRIKKAFELYDKGSIKKIQLTGGNAPGEISEAETAFNYLIKLGVRSEDITIEERTSTTTEQIQFIKNDILNKQKVDKIVLVSDHFHLSRVLEICKFYDVEAIGVSSDYSIKWGKLLFYKIRESIALLMFWFFAI